MSRFSSTGVGYHFGNFGGLNPYIGTLILICSAVLIVLGIVMLIRAIIKATRSTKKPNL